MLRTLEKEKDHKVPNEIIANKFQTINFFISRLFSVNFLLLLLSLFSTFINNVHDANIILIFQFMIIIFQIGYLNHIDLYTHNCYHFVLNGYVEELDND